MSSLITLADLRTQAQQRADQENSNFLSTTEWNTNINKSAKELYDLLTTNYKDYYLKTQSFTLSANQQSYPLPDDFYKLMGVDQIINSATGQAISVKPYNFQERNSYAQLQQSTDIKLHYIPEMTDLASDSDTFDGINGWEEYIIVDAAIKAMQKEESDVSILMAQKQAMRQRIEGAAVRDVGRPERVADIHSVDPFNYIQIPSRIRYRILANNISFVQCYVFGTVYE